MARSSASVAIFVAAFGIVLLGCGSGSKPAGSADGGSAASGVSPATPTEVADVAPARPAPPQPVSIMDRDGFPQPIAVTSLEVPGGWTTQGGVTWDRSGQCVGNFMRMRWRAVSPDGLQAFEILPGYSWQVQGTEIGLNPCPALPLRSAREFLALIAAQRFPGAETVGYRDRPDLAKQLSGGAEGPVTSPNGARAWYEGGEQTVRFMDGCKPMRAVLVSTVSFSQFQGNVVAGSPSASVQQAPDGAFDASVADRIRTSMRTNPEWIALFQRSTRESADRIALAQSQAISAWHNQRMQEINARGAMQRSQIAQQTNREVAEIYSNTWSNSQATDERIQRRTLEGVGEYNTYADPSAGRNVQSSIHDGDHVWKTGADAYVTTDDPNYQPPQGTELERVP